MIDLERALGLLTIVEKLAAQPKYANIRAQALAELDELNAPPAPMPEPVVVKNKKSDPEPEIANRRV